MVDTTIDSVTLANELKTAVESEETDKIAAAVKAITELQAEQAVIAELGRQLAAAGANNIQKTVVVFALNKIDHVDALHQSGKFLSDSTQEIGLRTNVLGLIEPQIQNHPTETLTYLRQVLEKAEPAFQERILASFEYAISEVLGQEPNPRKILHDAGIKPAHLRNSLFKNVASLDAATIPIPSICAEALGLLGGKESIDMLCQLLDKHQSEQLLMEQGTSGGNGRSANESMNKENIRERIMLAAVNALRTTESESAIHCLAEALDKNLNYKVQRQAADALGKLGFSSCIPFLLKALFTESNQSLRKKIGDSLKEIEGWSGKAAQLVTYLIQNPVQRDQIDAKLVLTAVQPRPEELTKKPHLMTVFLINSAVQQHKDQRLLQIFAELIKANTSNNATVINEQLEIYREKENVSEEILQALRVEIGGAQTLRPILNRLEKNLLDYFQKPIDSLNTDTQTIWKRTIFLANLGFFVRIMLNVTIFGLGAFFMIDSYRQIVAGNLTSQQLTALMAVFIGGGATMFATFFAFPLKQIKRAVTDVGLANVAFISYIHRVLQISHTFSYFYLNGKITFNEIKSAADQLEKTSHGAILTLNIAGSEGDQTQFDKALLDRIQRIEEKNANPPPDNNQQ